MNRSKHNPEEERNIAIWLDDYKDIFSDFDPRPYAERALSDDFINELKKVCNESEFKVKHLNLLMPEKMREAGTEKIITERIQLHVKIHYQNSLKRKRTIRNRSFLMIAIGLLCMIFAASIHRLQTKEFIYTILIVCFEPAGWFLIWTGLDDLLSITKRKIHELDFYDKLHTSKIDFKNSA